MSSMVFESLLYIHYEMDPILRNPSKCIPSKSTIELNIVEYSNYGHEKIFTYELSNGR